jgi:hypothetical protein
LVLAAAGMFGGSGNVDAAERDSAAIGTSKSDRKVVISGI